jgi:ribosome-binding protein aMBF1 (putative translation factor)
MSRVTDRPAAPAPVVEAPRRPIYRVKVQSTAAKEPRTPAEQPNQTEGTTYGFEAIEAIVMADADARRGFIEADAVIQAARFVRTLRERSGLSQRELAAKLAMEPSQLSKIERGVGTQGPTLKTLARIADACGRRLELRACTAGG